MSPNSIPHFRPRLTPLTILIAASVFALQNLPAIAEDWPQFLGPHRNGSCDGAALIPSFPDAGPRVLWKKDVGQGFSGPVVAQGKLILFQRLADRETVECLDAQTGAHIWSADYPTRYSDDFSFDPGPRATPTIAVGRVYTFGAEGTLSCFQLADGKNLWRVDTKKQYAPAKGFFGVACSTLVEGAAVILNLGGKGGAGGAGIVAFDRDTGKELWRATDDDASYSSPVAATINGKRSALAFTRAGLVALDPAGGKVFFKFPWRSRMDASVNAASPLVVGDEIFISASYNTGAALLRFGEPAPQKLWSGDDILSAHYATPVAHDGYLYGFDGRQEEGPNLRCVEWKTGKVRWSQDNFGAGTLMCAGNRLLILTEKGELILAAATPDKFTVVSRAQILAFDTRTYAALADGLYYARGKDKLVCLDLRSAKGPQ